MGLFSRTYECPGRQAMRPAPEGYYRDGVPRICCAIRECDDGHQPYPQWVNKALSKSGGDFYACTTCLNTPW